MGFFADEHIAPSYPNRSMLPMFSGAAAAAGASRNDVLGCVLGRSSNVLSQCCATLNAAANQVKNFERRNLYFWIIFLSYSRVKKKSNYLMSKSRQFVKRWKMGILSLYLIIIYFIYCCRFEEKDRIIEELRKEVSQQRLLMGQVVNVICQVRIKTILILEFFLKFLYLRGI